MKILLVLIIGFGLMACDKKDDKPTEVPPVVVEPTPVPTPVPLVCKNWESEVNGKCELNFGLVDMNQDICFPRGKQWMCGNPVWFGFKGCLPDENGDNGSEGTLYAKDKQALLDILLVYPAYPMAPGFELIYKDGTSEIIAVQAGPVTKCIEL